MLYGALLGKPLKERRNCQDVWCIAFQLMYRYRRELFPQKQCHRLWQHFVSFTISRLLLLFSCGFLGYSTGRLQRLFAWCCLLGSGRVYISCRGTVLHSRRAVFASSSLLYTLVRPSVSSILPLKEPSSSNYSKTHTRYQHSCRFGVTDCVLVEHLQPGLVQGSLDHISRPQQC